MLRVSDFKFRIFAFVSFLAACLNCALAGQVTVTTDPAYITISGTKKTVIISEKSAATQGVAFSATETHETGSVDGWKWTFPNGSPGDSDQQNPGLVTFSGSAPTLNLCTVGVSHKDSGTNCASTDDVVSRVGVAVAAIQISPDGSSYQALSGSNAKVIVGQQVKLKVVLPSEIQSQVSEYQWILTGNTFKSYEPSYNTGTLNPLTTSDLNQQTVTFYYADSGADRAVNVNVKINNQTFNIDGLITVVRPTASVATTTGTVGIIPGTLPELAYGRPIPGLVGVNFTPSVTIPTGFSGTTEWVQTYSVNRVFVWKSAAPTTWNVTGLDTDYPYSSASSTNDSPSSPLLSGGLSNTINDSAQMYLMFKPTGVGGTSQWVPLRVVNWAWAASATNTYTGTASGTSNWQLLSGSKSPATDSDTTSHPTWTLNIKSP